MKILLFIPAFNCEKQITRVLEKINRFGSLNFTEIIVINNQSEDLTFDVTSRFINGLCFKNIKIVTNSKNVNLGGTHKIAFQYAIDNCFDICVICHGDDQGNINNLREVDWRKVDKFFFGARFLSSSRLINYSKFRILGNIFFNLLASVITHRRIYDLGGSGLNVFPVELLKKHNFWNYSDDLTFHIYLKLNAIKMKQPFKYFPIEWSEEDQVSNVKLFSQTKKIFMLLIKFILFKKIINHKSKFNKSDTIFWI